ncbi:MAG: sodium-dependent bicarbonate transport family permease [Caldilineae bacterium]|nr:sodium-dependent bicarbonate transport family permease [Chloroflexota bacterium]MCB9177281.1 sodium-dependent bicarbonate transport family permease [Caldilineae bacterium]
MGLDLILGNLLAPPVLFFALGMAATLLRSDLEIPQAVTRGLSLYLLFSIGMHGGAELAAAGFSTTTLTPMLAGILASALIPLSTFGLLRRRIGAADAAAIGATYGSISAVTFITATSFLDARQIDWSGSMVAAMALMESPAILAGVLLARRAGVTAPQSEPGSQSGSQAELLREAFLNGPVFLLLGALTIGLLTGDEGWRSVAPFADAPFRGVLCLFLLDMGLIAARRLSALRESGAFLIGTAIGLPLVHASLAILAARALTMSPGDALLFTVLCASASYIAVPAAIRIALPQANPSLFLPMALALTFPFNVALGIPLYQWVIELLWRLP